MRQRRVRHASIGAWIALLAAAGCGPQGDTVAKRDCARAVILDWSDGSLDATYPDTCYLAALDSLPEDLRAYTSAGDDIRRALLSRRSLPARASDTPSAARKGGQNAPRK